MPEWDEFYRAWDELLKKMGLTEDQWLTALIGVSAAKLALRHGQTPHEVLRAMLETVPWTEVEWKEKH